MCSRLTIRVRTVFFNFWENASNFAVLVCCAAAKWYIKTPKIWLFYPKKCYFQFPEYVRYAMPTTKRNLIFITPLLRLCTNHEKTVYLFHFINVLNTPWARQQILFFISPLWFLRFVHTKKYLFTSTCYPHYITKKVSKQCPPHNICQT